MAALGDRVMVAVEHALERVSHMPQMLDLLSKIRLVVVIAFGKVGPGGGWRLRRSVDHGLAPWCSSPVLASGCACRTAAANRSSMRKICFLLQPPARFTSVSSASSSRSSL